jgi:hypothetical protein
MACPHFEPRFLLDWTSWRARLRPPLGALYSGVCRSRAEPFQPDGETLADNCNMGYASGRCPRFRSGAGDAVRFSIAPGAGSSATVRWLVESAGLPVLSGEVTCADADRDPIPGAPALVVLQLRAYAASYHAARASNHD